MQMRLVFNDSTKLVEARELSWLMCSNTLKLSVIRSKSHLIGKRYCEYIRNVFRKRLHPVQVMRPRVKGVFGIMGGLMVSVSVKSARL